MLTRPHRCVSLRFSPVSLSIVGCTGQTLVKTSKTLALIYHPIPQKMAHLQVPKAVVSALMVVRQIRRTLHRLLLCQIHQMPHRLLQLVLHRTVLDPMVLDRVAFLHMMLSQVLLIQVVLAPTVLLAI